MSSLTVEEEKEMPRGMLWLELGFHLDTLENKGRWIAAALVPVSDFAALFKFTIWEVSLRALVGFLSRSSGGIRNLLTPALSKP